MGEKSYLVISVPFKNKPKQMFGLLKCITASSSSIPNQLMDA